MGEKDRRENKNKINKKESGRNVGKRERERLHK